jgi:molybdopterin-guanine dinucleotide biosynthesis protein A
LQPVFALVPVTARGELERRLRAGEHKVEAWLTAQRLAIADFSDEAESFVNVNTEEEWRALEARLGVR